MGGNVPEVTAARLRAIERVQETLHNDYKEHVSKWREQYALVMMEQCKHRALEPLQTSAWKQGDLKKLLEEKPKKSHKRAAPADGALSMSSVKKEKQEDSLED